MYSTTVQVNVGPAMADKRFTEEIVRAHNDYRKRHQAAPLSHAKDLSAQAQKWADNLAASNSFQHSHVSLKGERLGENIAMKWSSRPDAYTGQEVTDQWYSEVKMHTFGGEPRTTGTGHFTQVVWQRSKEVGVGRAVTSDGKVIVVANYRPAGNLVGTYADNVLPPKDGKIVLPPEPASTPTTTTTRVTRGGGGGGGGQGDGTFSQRFEDIRKDFAQGQQSGGQSAGFKGESKTVRTFTTTEGVGPNKVTKTVTEETIVKASGEKLVNRRETTTTPGEVTDFGRLALTGHKTESKDKKKSKPFWKRGRSNSNSSSDSSPERGGKGSSSSVPQKNSSSTTARPQTMGDFQRDCLKAHNAKSSKHGAKSLSLANDLSKKAQKWAEHLAAKNMFEYSDCMLNGERVGENIANRWSSAPNGADYSGEDVVDAWYSEIKGHNYSQEGCMGTGHFTQVVWKGSKELGVGKAKDGKGKCIVVCSYRPTGNMMGAYKDNVSRPM